MKVNKSLILLVIFTLIMTILVGCNNKKQAPEGVTQEFYDDIIVVLNKLKDTKGELNTDNGEDIIKNYKEDDIWLSLSEKEILEAVEKLHFNVWFHKEMDKDGSFRNAVIHDIETVAELMELDIDIYDYVDKK